MSLHRTGLLCLVLLLCLAVNVQADGDLLSALDKRDKFYDITPWNGKIWFAGYPGHIISADKAGNNFTENLSNSKNALFALSSFDKDSAVAVGPDGLIMRTGDAGKSWTTVKVETKVPMFDVSTVKGTGKAWAVGHFNTILYSEDYGKSWQFQKYELPEDAADEPGLNTVHFLDELNGWIAGEFGIILKTADGGKSWLKMESPTEYTLYDIYFKDANTGVLAGAEGGAYITKDAGASWVKQDLAAKQHMFDISVVGEDIHLVGQDGYHAKGSFAEKAKWTTKRTGVYIWLNSVYFISKKEGYAAGGRGTIVKTDNGGTSWKQISGR